MSTRKSEALGLAIQLRERLVDVLGYPVQVILFGSHARGEATDASDIDVLILVTSLSAETLDAILEASWEVSFEAGRVISVAPATFEEVDTLSASPFFQAIHREGIQV